jgi:glycosyltransferase involved in cell wall biosynthesis
MITNVIALLDKPDPPAHAFVDGLLASVLAKGADVRVRLIVSRSSSTPGRRRPRRYLRAVCVPRLFRRRGFGRFANLAQSLRLVVPQIIKARKRGENVVILVRNCPILGLAGVLIRPWVGRLVVQSSFPHELVSGTAVMRWLARSMYRAAAGGVDAILAVSPLGLERMRRIYGPDVPGDAIPLLTDVPAAGMRDASGDREWEDDLRFVYVGSHDSKRDLDVVMQAIDAALDRGVRASFRFVGGHEAEVRRLRRVGAVAEWERSGRIEFAPPVPRAEIWRDLARSAVGLCLINPLPEYREASPTKLVEYMAMGLAVIANRGIDLQETILEESGGGLLTAWDPGEIADAIMTLASRPSELRQRRRAARRYVDERLNPQAYLGRLRTVLGLDEQPPVWADGGGRRPRGDQRGVERVSRAD